MLKSLTESCQTVLKSLTERSCQTARKMRLRGQDGLGVKSDCVVKLDREKKKMCEKVRMCGKVRMGGAAGLEDK